MSRTLLRLGLLAMLGLAMALAALRPPTGVHATIEIRVPDPLTPVTLKTVFDRQSSIIDCEGRTGNVVRVALERCPACQVIAARCDAQLSDADIRLLSGEPLPFPTGRLTNGTMAFLSEDADTAHSACKAASRSTAGSANPLTCQQAGSARPLDKTKAQLTSDHGILVLLAAFTAWLVGWFIVRYEHLHSHLTHDAVGSGPQKNHVRPTPRIGGVQVCAGLVAGWIALSTFRTTSDREAFGLLLACLMPAFLGGLLEDVTRKVGVIERLLMTMLSGALACWLLGAVVNRIDVPLVDPVLALLPVGIVFTSFAVGGIANSINIIDGFHGLASGVTMIVASAIAYIAWSVGDATILTLALVMIGALAGFFVWNWPRGLIFLGDGGAYLVGALTAELAVLLVMRHPTISPWFPVLVLCHPVVETLVSIARRQLNPGAAVGGPDSDHLHQRLFRFLYGAGVDIASSNSRVAKFFWLAGSLTAVVAVSFAGEPGVLAGAVTAYALIYLAFYRITAR